MGEEMREELVNTLHKIAADHLISDAPQPVVLANQVLREELAERLPQLGLKSSESEVSSAVDDVWSARNDPKLWKSLDSALKTFVANKPSPSVRPDQERGGVSEFKINLHKKYSAVGTSLLLG